MTSNAKKYNVIWKRQKKKEHTSTVTATFLTLVDAIEWEKHLKKGGVTVCEVHPVFTDW
jgi:hypothetical protein